MHNCQNPEQEYHLIPGSLSATLLMCCIRCRDFLHIHVHRDLYDLHSTGLHFGLYYLYSNTIICQDDTGFIFEMEYCRPFDEEGPVTSEDTSMTAIYDGFIKEKIKDQFQDRIQFNGFREDIQKNMNIYCLKFMTRAILNSRRIL